MSTLAVVASGVGGGAGMLVRAPAPHSRVLHRPAPVFRAGAGRSLFRLLVQMSRRSFAGLRQRLLVLKDHPPEPPAGIRSDLLRPGKDTTGLPLENRDFVDVVAACKEFSGYQASGSIASSIGRRRCTDISATSVRLVAGNRTYARAARASYAVQGLAIKTDLLGCSAPSMRPVLFFAP